MKRFIDMGREMGADASKEEFERAFKKMFSPKHGAPTREAHEAKTPRRKRPDKADT
jgi:hypothetical protein